jgi:hypothetical protein
MLDFAECRARRGAKPHEVAHTMDKILTCTIGLTKSGGIKLTVKDGIANITQTIEMDGAAITTTVQGPTSTSTVTQKDASLVYEVKGPQKTSKVEQIATGLTITCDNFTVDAETITMKSSKDETHTVSGKLDIQATGNASISTDAALALESKGATSIKSTQATSIEATQNFSAQGQNVTLKGLANATVQATATAAMKGAKVEITGQAQASVAAPITDIGQSVTTVKGQMVKVEGTLVKLG